jgi:hypothetical protein
VSREWLRILSPRRQDRQGVSYSGRPLTVRVIPGFMQSWTEYTMDLNRRVNDLSAYVILIHSLRPLRLCERYSLCSPTMMSGQTNNKTLTNPATALASRLSLPFIVSLSCTYDMLKLQDGRSKSNDQRERALISGISTLVGRESKHQK